MTIPELRNNFIINLHTSYPKEEIVSFFYLLAEHRMNLKRVDIALNPATNISNKDKDYFLNAIEKLKQEIPIQYIIDEKGCHICKSHTVDKNGYPRLQRGGKNWRTSKRIGTPIEIDECK